jgi:hypothetical protein
MPEPIRYCVTVDTEEEWDWNSGYPTGLTFVRNIAELPKFQAVCEKAGAAVVYFTNHAVLSDTAATATIQELATRPRTEIGLHIHPWNTPPVAPVSSVSPRDSFLHNLPWYEQAAKLSSTLDAFRAAGITPTSFRGGRYSTSPAIQDFLRDNGVWVDCSVLPWNTWADDGAPDFRPRGLDPVRLPPRQPGDNPMWELPLTFGFTRRPFGLWAKILAAADTKLGRLFRLTGVLDRSGIASRTWLNFENPLGNQILKFLAALRNARPPFVSFTLHSSSLMSGGSPYARTPADVARILENVERTLATVAGWPDFTPATVTEIATHLEAAHR